MDLKEYTIGTLMESTASVYMYTTTTKTTLFTVPATKTFYPVFVSISSPTTTLAACTSVQLGTDATCTTWITGVNLSSLTDPSYYAVISPALPYVRCAASSAFGIYIVTGSAAACTAVVDVWGFLK